MSKPKAAFAILTLTSSLRNVPNAQLDLSLLKTASLASALMSLNNSSLSPTLAKTDALPTNRGKLVSATALTTSAGQMENVHSVLLTVSPMPTRLPVYAPTTDTSILPAAMPVNSAHPTLPPTLPRPPASATLATN